MFFSNFFRFYFFLCNFNDLMAKCFKNTHDYCIKIVHDLIIIVMTLLSNSISKCAETIYI